MHGRRGRVSHRVSENRKTSRRSQCPEDLTAFGEFFGRKDLRYLTHDQAAEALVIPLAKRARVRSLPRISSIS